MIKEKLCIYLDQFAISNIESSVSGTLWYQIRCKLQILYAEGKIYCPLSCEHILEASNRDRMHAINQNLFFEELSDGYIFRPEEIIASYEIAMYIRQKQIKKFKDGYLLKHVDDIFSRNKIYDKAHNIYNLYKTNMQAQYEWLNDLRSVSRSSSNIRKEEKKIFISAMNMISVNKFITYLEALYDRKYIQCDESLKSFDIICYNLINKRHFSKKDIGLLIKELELNGFNNIPSLNIKTRLNIFSALDNKKRSSNDDIDISRATTAFAFSDYFFADKQRKHELVELQFDKRYGTRIFSGTECDLKNFILELDALLYS